MRSFPRPYECDCGHQSHFCENTIREMKAMSHRKRVRLGDAAPDEHFIVFYQGKMVDIIGLHNKSKNPSGQ